MAPMDSINDTPRTAIATTEASTVSPLISVLEQLESTQATGPDTPPTVSNHAAHDRCY